jgi:hypothetical protein
MRTARVEVCRVNGWLAGCGNSEIQEYPPPGLCTNVRKRAPPLPSLNLRLGSWAERRRTGPAKPLRRWRRSTFARAVVLSVSGRFATWSRRGPRRRRVAGQSGAFETLAIFASSHHCRILAAVHAAHELSITSIIWCSVKHPQSVRTQAVCPESVCALVPEVVSEMATIAEFGVRS